MLRFSYCQLQKLRSLAGLLPFWRYQVQKLRKSRRIASFSSLQIADRQIDRLIDNYNDNYHYTTLHYTTLQPQLQLQTQINYATLHYTNNTNYTTTTQLLLPQLQQQHQLHHITLHCANYTAVHYSYKCKCNYNYTTLHNTTTLH